MKKWIALLLAAALLGSIPALAAEAEPPAPDDVFVLGGSSESGDLTVVDTTEGGSPALFRAFRSAPAAGESDSGLPRQWDPRGSAYLPPVRSQGSWNTCWVMSAISAAEIDALKNGLTSVSPSRIDLSERHLLYFFSHPSDDPLGNSSLDYNTNPSFWIRRGGNPILAAMTMASWHGPASEAATASPYTRLSTDDFLDSAYAYADELHLEETAVLNLSTGTGRDALKQMLLDHGGAVLCLYYDSRYLFAGSPTEAAATPTPAPTPEPTPEVTPEPTDEPTPFPLATVLPIVTETPIVIDDPKPTLAIASEDNPAADSEPDGTPAPEPVPVAAPEPEPTEDASARPILDGAPDQEPPLTDDAAFDAATDARADDFTVCYYQDAVASQTNHEVVVIGWDDDYPAENFGWSSQGALPPADGAWLCRNSYGEHWSGGDGYFWISYYDTCVSYDTNSIDGRATVFRFTSADDYDNNYEYDGAAILGYVNDSIGGRGVSTLTAAAGSQRWYANVFTAAANDSNRGYELLRAVSTYSYRPNVSYTVEIYTNLTDPSDPLSGTLAASLSGAFAWPGLHTIPLDSAVTLREGAVFSVVFRVSRASDGSIFVPACYTNSSWYSTNDIRTGQSFVSLDGSAWYDGVGLKNTPNVRIKAYTDNAFAEFPFHDVAPDAWYRDDVETGWLNRLIEGVTPTTFEPDSYATRAQVIAVLRRLAGDPAPVNDTAFGDVPASAWYYDDVRWAEGVGLAAGSDDDGDGVFLFRPNDPITREELLTILFRFAGFLRLDNTGQADLSGFADGAAVSPWAQEAVRWSMAEDLTLGFWSAPRGFTLRPQEYVARAQLVVWLNRFSALM